MNRCAPLWKLCLGFSVLAATAWGALAENPAQTSSAPLPAGVERITSVEGITEYALPNGLRVLLFPDPSRPIITVNITYKVGSRHENYGETGMAHLLEHLVFKGTPKHPNIPQELTEHGARANGTTWFDRTNYYETVSATEENLRWALELEADRMINSHISRADLEKEFTVVRNEFERGENSPGGVLYKRMLPAVFQWHNYGHSTIGERSDIEGAPIERLKAFYKEYYQPDNAVLVVAGRIDETKTLGMVNEYFASIPKPTRKIIPTYTSEPTQDGERQIVLRRTGDVQIVSCMFRTVAVSHPDDTALNILANVLTDAPSGRLYKTLVETQKAATVSASASGFAEAGMFQISAEVRKEKSLEEAQATLLATLEDLQKNPPTEEEVTRARTRMLKNFELFLKRSDQIGLRLSESIGAGDWRLAFLERDRLEKVTPADVTRVASTYLKTSNRVIGLFIPEDNADRVTVPAAPAIAEVLKDYKGKPPISQGEVFAATPENIEKRVTRGSFDNGMKYALLPKETRGDSVNASITLHFGTLEALQNKAMIARFTGAMLDRGTKTKTRQQIKDTLDRLRARVGTSGGATAASAGIETDRQNLPEALKLAAELLREPSFPEDEFKKLKQEWLADLESQKKDPSALAGNMYARISRPFYAPADPRYTRTFEEQAAAIEAVKLEDVKEFHAQFYGASNATAAIVGDFDPQANLAVLKEQFGSWKSPQPYTRIADDYREVTPREETIQTPDKANAVYLAGFGFPMRDDDPEYPAIAIGGHMIGGGFLNSRLATRIRQKEGLSYGVGGGFSADALDKDASFYAQMIYAPENLQKLGTAFREEIERAANEGFTNEELEAAKTGWLKSREVGRSTDSGLAGMLNGYLFYGRDFTFDAAREKKVRELTKEEVDAAIKKHLNFARMIFVRAGDFKKTAPAKATP